MVDLTHLHTFRAVVETGSITAAAAQLGLSQPGLSRQIQRLERDLGVTLLERTSRGVRVTDEGRPVLDFAHSALSQYEELLEGLQGELPVSGEVRIVASTTPGEYLVPGTAAAFGDQYPLVRAVVQVTDSAAVPVELIERRWDVGFVGTPSDLDGLTQIPVARDEVILAVPGSHEFAAQAEIDVHRLEGERLIQREDGSGTRRTVVQALAARGLSLPADNSALTLGSTQAVLSAVDSGLGVGFVTLKALERHRSERVAAVRLQGGAMIRDLYFVYEIARPHSRQAQKFIDFVTDTARLNDGRMERG